MQKSGIWSDLVDTRENVSNDEVDRSSNGGPKEQHPSSGGLREYRPSDAWLVDYRSSKGGLIKYSSLDTWLVDYSSSNGGLLSYRSSDEWLVDYRSSIGGLMKYRSSDDWLIKYRSPNGGLLDYGSIHGTPVVYTTATHQWSPKMPSDSMDDIELKSIQLQFPNARTMSRDDSNVTEERVETGRGSVLVAVQGNRKKPAIVTYHDLGLNYISSFQAFFNYIDMRALLEHFCVYHVNAPGQEENAAPLPDDFIYPTMDELAEQIDFVLSHYELKNVIGFGVGAGANVLARFALAHPTKVGALCLINCMSTQAGWIEWGYQKLNARHLRSKGMTQGVLDYLMWHHFGRNTEERNHDLVQVYKAYFERHVNPSNLALLIDSYIRRTDLSITRELEPSRRKDAHTLKMPVMNITGALSPHVDDTVTLNGRLDPTNSTWMKIQDCGMVLEEQPGKVSEAFRLFLQGEGYTVNKLIRKYSTASSTEGKSH